MSSYYVYAHRNPLTKRIFYIGKGHGDRGHAYSGRNRYWRAIVGEIHQSGLTYSVEILHICDTEEEALLCEQREIRKRVGLTNRPEPKSDVCPKYNNWEYIRLKEIGNKIKEHRQYKGFSVRDLAKKTGMSRTTLCKIENGINGKYELRNLVKILDVLALRISLP